MEVSGRKESFNVDSGKAVIFCQPCQSDNESVPAEGYCETCNEFICTSCIKAHQKLATTKNHVIKPKDQMQTTKTESDPCTELCAHHETEIVKFYCEEHDCVGCGDCMVLGHKSCKVQLVSDVSGNYDKSYELIGIKQNIDHLKKNIAACKQEITQSLNVAEETKTTILEEIKKFREEMNIYLNQVEADLIKELDQMSSNNITKQKQLQTQCESMENEMKEFQSNIDKFSDQMNQLFVSSKQIQKRLQRCQKENRDISFKSEITTCLFEPSIYLKTLIINNSSLGKLSSEIKKFPGPCKKSFLGITANFKHKVKVTAAKEETCYITGMAMISAEKILMADSINSCLKILNVREGKIISKYKPSSGPWDVTVIDSDDAAVTLPDQGTLLFMNTKNVLCENYSLKVRGGCFGIDHRNGIIAVTFCTPPAVQVLDMTGNILHEVHDTTMLLDPLYKALCNDTRSMFVSDFDTNTVFQFTEDGYLKAKCKSEKFKCPSGLIVTSDGTAVVCAGKNARIITQNFRQIPLLKRSDVKPVSIIVFEEENKLFLCEHDKSKDCNYMKIYDLK